MQSNRIIVKDFAFGNRESAVVVVFPRLAFPSGAGQSKWKDASSTGIKLASSHISTKPRSVQTQRRTQLTQHGLV